MASRFAPSPSILNFMASSPNYGKLGSTGAMENLKTAAQNLVSNAGIHSAGIQGKDLVDGAKYDAVGIRAEGAAQGHAAMMGGISSGISGLTGGIMSKYGSIANTAKTGTDTLGFSDLKAFGRSDADIATITSGGFIDHGYL